jgi:negative regulator of flagellin synthesis FlgM
MTIIGSNISMKIDDLNQKSAVAYLVGRTDKSEPADVHAEAVSKSHASADKVELSGYMPVTSKSQQGLRASRVEEVKAQIASGSYQVSSQAVAEKMLSKLVLI